MSGVLVLVRHGQSEGNRADLFTGWRDVDLSEQGHVEAISAGARLNALGLKFDMAFTSALRRARKTCGHILLAVGQGGLTAVADPALNERDYGDLTGLSKDEARRKWGYAQVEAWRRSYVRGPPRGESLKDTGARVWPYYMRAILPPVLGGCSVLVVAHGNSLRALVMAVEGLSADEILEVEIATGVPIVYRLNADSTCASKQVFDR